MLEENPYKLHIWVFRKYKELTLIFAKFKNQEHDLATIFYKLSFLIQLR